MKVCVTGAAGFLGSHVVEKLLEDGNQVVGVDNLIGGDRNNVPAGCDFTQWDLNELSGLADVVKGCDTIVHCACTAYEGLSVFSPSLVVANTLQIAVNIMTAGIQAGVHKFVHCSSMARYGAQEVTPFTEDMDCKPQDPYGIAKYGAELLLRNMADVHGVNLVIAIPHNIIGPRQKYDDPYRNVASIMINLMLQGRQPVIYGDGTQVRCFSDIDDDLPCLMKMVYGDFGSGDVYNIGPDESPVTIIDLAGEIAGQLGFKLDPVFMPGRPQEVKFATCSANKIRKDFGYQTRVTLAESISKMINYVQDNGVKPFEYHLPIEILNESTPSTWAKQFF